MIPDWLSTDGLRAWNSITLGGVLLQGTVKVSDGARDWRINSQPVIGSNGAKITDEGRDLCQFRVKISTAQYSYAQANERALSKIQDKKATSPLTPVEVVHPAINCLGVTKVLLKSVGIPVLENDVLSVELRLFEWQPKPKEQKKGTFGLNGNLPTFQQVVIPPFNVEEYRSGRDSDMQAADVAETVRQNVASNRLF